MALARGGVALAALSRFEPKKTERTPQRLKWRSQTGERQAVYDPICLNETGKAIDRPARHQVLEDEPVGADFELLREILSQHVDHCRQCNKELHGCYTTHARGQSKPSV